MSGAPDLASAALDYAAQGLPVFPCNPATKSPLTPNGFRDASRDPATITRWWSQSPSAMIGIPTGEASGFWALDVDDPEAFEAAALTLPVTRKVKTGKGYHLHFANDPEVRNAQRHATRGWPFPELPGAEVRGEGGYVIVPPSVHPSGKAYTWANNEMLVSAPANLLEIVTRKRGNLAELVLESHTETISTSGGIDTPYGLKALENECVAILFAGDGEQESTLNEAALKIGALVAGGELSAKTAKAKLIEAGLGMTSHDPRNPWTDAAVRKKVERGLADGGASPRSAPARDMQFASCHAPAEIYDPETGEVLATGTSAYDRAISTEGPMPLFRPLPAAPEYPANALGSVLAPAANAIAEMAQCAIACAANSVLAVASLAAQGRANAVLPIGQGKRTPLSLYLLTVLESGERKSTADSFALKPVRDFERELAEAEAGERMAYQARAAAYETTAKALHSKLKNDRAALEAALHALGPAPLPPLLSILAPGGDQTFEGLFRIYQQGRPSLAMLCDDGASFLGGHSLKAENKAGTTANLCRAWDGSRLERIRSLDGVSVLYDRRLAAHIMIQPGVAGDFLGDAQFADQGLLARFLLSAPGSLAGTDRRLRSEDAASERADAARAAADLAPYNAVIGRLLRAPIRWKNEHDRSAGIELDELPLSDDARRLYIRLHNATMEAMGTGKALESVRPFANKLTENAVRLAGILTLVADSDAIEINAETLADAAKLAQYYADEAVRLTDAAATDPAMKRADQLLRWLLSRTGDMIGLATVYQSCQPKSLRTAKAAREAMEILAAHGWVTSVPGGATIDGKRHREVWRIMRGGQA